MRSTSSATREDGAVQLGSAKLDFDSLLKRATAIKKWGNALTENGRHPVLRLRSGGERRGQVAGRRDRAPDRGRCGRLRGPHRRGRQGRGLGPRVQDRGDRDASGRLRGRAERVEPRPRRAGVRRQRSPVLGRRHDNAGLAGGTPGRRRAPRIFREPGRSGGNDQQCERRDVDAASGPERRYRQQLDASHGLLWRLQRHAGQPDDERSWQPRFRLHRRVPGRRHD